jgi:hypothetical protein
MPTVAELPSIAQTSPRYGRRLLLRPLVWSILSADVADLLPMFDSDLTVVRAWSAPSASYWYPGLRD